MSPLALLTRIADRVADLLGPPPPVATCDEPGAGWLAALEVPMHERGAA